MVKTDVVSAVAVRIGSNIASLKAQRLLGEASSSLSTVFQRLSSGQRINQASDDAAGLAIADSLRADSRIFSVAIRNISDGISAFTIADGALSQQGGIITRMRELAQQSASGTFSYTQRASLQDEFEALASEYFRISESTTFNGRKLLDGSSSSLSIEVGGTGAGRSIKGDLPSILKRNGVLDISAYQAGGGSLFQATYDTLLRFFDRTEITQEELDQYWSGNIIYTQGLDDTGENRDVAVLIGASYGSHPVFMKGLTRSLTDPNKWEGTWDLSDYSDISDKSIIINGDGTFDGTGLNISGSSTGTLTLRIDSNSGVLSVDVNLSGIKLKHTGLNVGANLSSIGPIDALRIAANSTTASQQLSRQALDALELLLVQNTTFRGQLGTAMNRLSVASSNLLTMRENYISAESRIRDADIADETSKLVRNNILQQVGAAILAQANQAPSLALSLLRN